MDSQFTNIIMNKNISFIMKVVISTFFRKVLCFQICCYYLLETFGSPVCNLNEQQVYSLAKMFITLFVIVHHESCAVELD